MADVGDPLAALRAAAVSPRWEDRVVAARGLAPYAQEPAVAALLRRLLVDPEDVGVTSAAADALLARDDLVGVEIFAAGLVDGSCDDQCGEHMIDAVRSRVPVGRWHGQVFVEFGPAELAGERLVELLERAAASADPEVARGARGVLDWLGCGET